MALRVLALAFAFVLYSCGSGGREITAVQPCPRNALVSVAPVNGWPGIADPEDFASELERGCQGLTQIEAFAWWDRSGACDGAHPGLCTETYREKRRAFLRSMSAHKVTTLITSMNSNAEGPRRLSDDAFGSHVREIRADAEEVGLQWVWLGAPSEPWADPDQDRARRRAEIARVEWPAVFVLPDAGANHATGRPYFGGVAFDMLEVHPCTVDDARAAIARGAPILTVTDCGSLLVPPAEEIRALTREALALEQPLLFYDFAAVGPNIAAIAAVGDEIRSR